MAELDEEMSGLTSLFQAIDEAVKDSTESFVRSFNALPEAVVMTSDEMVQNFRERFVVSEIFKDQIEQLKAMELDDLAIFAAQQGPEFAVSLQNLLQDPEALRELEAGLEATENTLVEGLKEQSTRIQLLYEKIKELVKSIKKQMIGFLNSRIENQEAIIKSTQIRNLIAKMVNTNTILSQ